MRVCFKAVVNDPKLGESRHQFNQVNPTPVVSFPNLLFGNIVSPTSHSRSNSRHVQFGAAQSDEQDADLDSSLQRLLEKRGDCLPSERRFEREVQAFGDRSFKQALPLMPGGAVRFRGRNTRIGAHNPGRCSVGVEVVGAGLPKHRARYAALASAVGPGEHVDAGAPLRPSHACASRLPPPSQAVVPMPQTLPSWLDEPWVFASAREAHRTRA